MRVVLQKRFANFSQDVPQACEKIDQKSAPFSFCKWQCTPAIWKPKLCKATLKDVAPMSPVRDTGLLPRRPRGKEAGRSQL